MKLPRATRILAATLLSLALASCGSPEPAAVTPAPTPPAVTPAVSPTPAEAVKPEIAVARSLNAFGLDLHRVLSAENPNANLLTSPYALGTGLAMLSCGADGETLAEFRKVLHLPEEEVMLKGFGELNSRLQPDPSKAGSKNRYRQENLPILMATRLYGQTGFDYNPDFLGKLSTAFHSKLEAVDFAKGPELARERINAWVSGKTSGQIGSLLPEGAITPETTLSLVAALHFADQWLDMFEPGNTRPARFYLSDGKEVMTPTMFQEENLDFHIGDGFKAVALDYVSDPTCRFVICVPDAKNGLHVMEQKLSETIFTGPKTFKNNGRKIRIHLPKFTFQAPPSHYQNR